MGSHGLLLIISDETYGSVDLPLKEFPVGWSQVKLYIGPGQVVDRSEFITIGSAVNGHSRCVRLLFADVVPSVPNFWNSLRADQGQQESLVDFDLSACSRIANKPADGGITVLPMAALNGHAESVQLVLDLGANISTVTVQDGSIIDLTGAGSTPLHYAACGGNIQCCQILIARGASCSAENANGVKEPATLKRRLKNLTNKLANKSPSWNVCTKACQILN